MTKKTKSRFVSCVFFVSSWLFLPTSAPAQPPSPKASASLAVAQSGGGGWIEYVSKTDLFSINFPDQPRIEEI